MTKNKRNFKGSISLVIAPEPDPTVRGTPPFVIAETGKVNADPDYTYKHDSKDRHLLLYTQSGKGLLTYMDGKYELPSGSLALIDLNKPHEYRAASGAESKWIFYWMEFSSGHADFYLWMIYRDLFNVLDTNYMPMVIFEEIAMNLKRNDPENLLFLSDCVYKMLTLMTEVSRKNEGLVLSIKKKERISNIADYIKKNYWQHFDLDKLTAYFGVSKYYFLRQFKEQMGMTPYQYLTVERVNVAKLLLERTDSKLHEVCIMSGFVNQGNFARTFKGVVGLTPHEYRLKYGVYIED